MAYYRLEVYIYLNYYNNSNFAGFSRMIRHLMTFVVSVTVVILVEHTVFVFIDNASKKFYDIMDIMFW